MPKSTSGYRTIAYRLLPETAVKGRRLASVAGACRYVWNVLLDDQEALYHAARMCGAKPPSPTFFTLGKAFTDLRRVTPWLAELPFAPIRYTLKYQAEAWQRFFAGKGGHPRFKARRGEDSVTLPENVRIADGRLWFPKVGWLTLRRRGGNPYPDGLAKQATIRRSCGKWYCTVVYAIEINTRADDGLALGVDMNVGQIAVSTGAMLHRPDIERLEARRRRYQRLVARRKKGSNRQLRAKRRVARVARQIALCRRNWHDQASRIVANSAGHVVLEDLKLRNMTRSAKGTPEEPGTNVRAKAGLNRVLLGTGLADIARRIEEKALSVERVNPAYTSQTCSVCGVTAAESRRTQSLFRCIACGAERNADVNAAINILASGTGAAGRRGALTLVTPATRQMDISTPYGS